MKRSLFLLSLLALPILTAPAQAADLPSSIPLWEKGAPGFEARKDEPEKVETDGKGLFNVDSVHNPSVTPFLTAPDKNTGAAVIIAPGGGHSKLCLGHEGYSLGQWFADHGIAAFVLKYRLAREPGSVYTIDAQAMADTRLVRSPAGDWAVKTDRLGVLGFSARGELAALAAISSDPGKADAPDPVERHSSRPDFQGLIYPGSSKRFTVEKGMPPVFIVWGYGDRPDIAEGMAGLYLKYKAAGVQADLHIYSNTGHGFGYRSENIHPAGAWPQRFQEWLADSGFLKK